MGPDEFSGEGCLNGQMAFVVIKRLLAIVGRNLLRPEKPPQPYQRDLELKVPRFGTNTGSKNLFCRHRGARVLP